MNVFLDLNFQPRSVFLTTKKSRERAHSRNVVMRLHVVNSYPNLTIILGNIVVTIIDQIFASSFVSSIFPAFKADPRLLKLGGSLMTP